MRPVHIVVEPPFLDDLARVAIAGVEPLVETLVPEPSDEAFDQTVRHRPSRRNVMPLDLLLLLPGQRVSVLSTSEISRRLRDALDAK